MVRKAHDGELEYYGLCQTPGCYRVMDLTWYKGKFLCRNCITPWDIKQLKVEDFVVQAKNAYTPENTPLPGFSQDDIVALRKRRANNWGRGKRVYNVK
jgi:hypothetical protein